MSAGMNADAGAAICPQVQERLVALGERGRQYAADFRSRPVKSLDLGTYGLLLGATADLRAELVRRQPGIRNRSFTVLEVLALSKLPLAGSERNEFRNHGLAAVLLARRGTVAPNSVRLGGKQWASWDIPDGHNERHNRHHLATIDLAEKAGTELGLRLLDWNADAIAGTGSAG